MERVTTSKTDRQESDPEVLLVSWQHYLQEQDYSAGTVKKYIQALSHFLTWYEQEEHVALQLTTITPIALIGYRNELQHEQHTSISTRLSAPLTYVLVLCVPGALGSSITDILPTIRQLG